MIKEEPFEKFFVPETSFQLTIEEDEPQICCLCPEGKKLQRLLYQHIKDVHPYDSKFLKLL